MDTKDTIEFDNIIENVRDYKELKKHLDNTIKDLTETTFHEYFLALLEEKKLSKSKVISTADISKSYGYQIFDGSRKPSRDTAIKLSIVGGLSLKETERALTLAGVSKLYSKIPRDFIILFCIKSRKSLIETNDFLFSEGELVLGDK
ncbi:MAG: helix-turn-helix domain-containing protein [Clostridium sp.]